MKFLAIFICVIVCGSAFLAAGADAGAQDRPKGAVILVVDGFGASYVYPEYTPYSMDGEILPKATLFNLTGRGSRVLDIRVPVPETTKSHTVLVTGNSNADPEMLGSYTTIFDIARDNGYLCLAVLERGDSREMLLKMDAVIHLGDNSIIGARPTTGSREGLAENVSLGLEIWRDRFQSYTSVGSKRDVDAYKSYNTWAFDVASYLVERHGDQPFLMLVNAGATDSAGQDLGPEMYVETIESLDAPLGRLEEACKRKGVLLVATADHGMSFATPRSKGGHASGEHASRLESLRIPAVFILPGEDNLILDGVWSQEDIAPTVLSLMGLPDKLSGKGEIMPVTRSCSLEVAGGSGNLTVYRNGQEVARSNSGDEVFTGLEMGNYKVSDGYREEQILLKSHSVLDLGSRPGLIFGSSYKTILGSLIIAIINLTGIFLIARVLRRE